MVTADDIKKKLTDLSIPFQIVYHPPTLDIKEADEYIKDYEGVRTKSLLLTDQKKRKFFLFVLDEEKPLDLKKLAEMLEVKRLKFASDATIKEKIDLVAGVVSPFGLLNNKERDILFLLDTDIKDLILTFHPNECNQTIFIHFDDLVQFLEIENCRIRCMKL